MGEKDILNIDTICKFNFDEIQVEPTYAFTTTEPHDTYFPQFFS